MEKKKFIEKVAKFVEAHHILRRDEGYLVAVSGGADSVVLLRVLLELGYRCTVAHCNFHLRGEESVRDERFVTRLCHDLGVECEVTHFDVAAYEREHGVSTEMACRELRYAWFRKLLHERGLAAVVVAHHSDDNIETLFLNLLRGSGIAGLAAMQPVRGDVRRPLLGVSRHEIEAYAVATGQSFVTDSTNLESVVKRNRLRNIVLPELRRQFPEADVGLQRTIANVQQCSGLYGRYVSELRQDCVSGTGEVERIDVARLAARTGESLATAIFELVRPYGFNSAQAAEMATAQVGKRFLSATHTATMGRDAIEIYHTQSLRDDKEYIVDLRAMTEQGGSCPRLPIAIEARLIDAAGFTPRSVDGKRTVCFDAASLLRCRLALRHWRRGDRFAPFGMRGTRLVSDIFSDLKLTEHAKRSQWILTADGTPVWLPGLRSSRHHCVSPGTKSIVLLTVAE